MGCAPAVLCGLRTHNLPRSTNQAGETKKRRMQECRKSLFSAFFVLSSILTVCMRENNGIERLENSIMLRALTCRESVKEASDAKLCDAFSL